MDFFRKKNQIVFNFRSSWYTFVIHDFAPSMQQVPHAIKSPEITKLEIVPPSALMYF